MFSLMALHDTSGLHSWHIEETSHLHFRVTVSRIHECSDNMSRWSHRPKKQKGARALFQANRNSWKRTVKKQPSSGPTSESKSTCICCSSAVTHKRSPCKIVIYFLYCGFNGMWCGNAILKQSRVNRTVVLRYKTGANEKFKTFCSCFWPWQGLCGLCMTVMSFLLLEWLLIPSCLIFYSLSLMK